MSDKTREQRLSAGGWVTYVGSITKLHGPAYCWGPCRGEHCEDVATFELTVFRPGLEHTVTHVSPGSIRLHDEPADEPEPNGDLPVEAELIGDAR
jgi:hypothetical protein